jgi:hypothetical protein
VDDLEEFWKLGIWHATRRTYRGWRTGLVVTILLGVVGVIGLAELIIDEPSWWQRGGIYLLAAIATNAVALLIAVPVALLRQRNDARREIADLERALDSETIRTLDLELEALEPRQPANLASAYRLSMRVLNQGHPGRFFAKVLRPVEGIAEPGYGDFYVQWDLEADIEKKLERGEAHTLHVAALKDRTLRFLGPETVYGKQTIYKGVKVSSPEVRILVRFCDTGAGVDRVRRLSNRTGS